MQFASNCNCFCELQVAIPKSLLTVVDERNYLKWCYDHKYWVNMHRRKWYGRGILLYIIPHNMMHVRLEIAFSQTYLLDCFLPTAKHGRFYDLGYDLVILCRHCLHFRWLTNCGRLWSFSQPGAFYGTYKFLPGDAGFQDDANQCQQLDLFSHCLKKMTTKSPICISLTC